MLTQLNERMMGRTHDGFATALAAHITRDGKVSIASAGHLPPYLNGREIDLAPALPLGIMGGACYDTVGLLLDPDSRLTFYTDGVVEAQNRNHELFGFDRGRDMSAQPAAMIAEAAMEFGQQDDITIISIERIGGTEMEPVDHLMPVSIPRIA
jgi:phosphoserine phosphatase RsbU/P